MATPSPSMVGVRIQHSPTLGSAKKMVVPIGSARSKLLNTTQVPGVSVDVEAVVAWSIAPPSMMLEI
jgi:hypothetical protein